MRTRDEILELIGEWQRKGYTVIAPRRTGEIVNLAVVERASDIDFDHILTVNTLKEVTLPRCEILFKFDVEKVEIESPREDPSPFVVFGSRPCDAAALAILDSILMGEVKDSRYARRRSNMVLVTLGCSTADEACFCTSMGYGPHDTTGSDIILLPSQGGYLVQVISDRGKDFAQRVGLSPDQGEPDPEPQLRRKISIEGMKAWLDENFENPKWEKVSENCVSCGTCYYLCPTCHCFDIADEAGLARGVRMRIWDCCSFSSFTRMAAHQPRVGKFRRYRQRIMHKFKYTVDNVGKTACVGDGRCIRYCPYGVDITEVLQSLKE